MIKLKDGIVTLVPDIGVGASVKEWNYKEKEFYTIAWVPCCSFKSEHVQEKTFRLPEGFKGALINWDAQVGDEVELVGFTENELNEPIQMLVWAKKEIPKDKTIDCRLIKTFGEYLSALATVSVVRVEFPKAEFHPVSGNLLIQLPCETGRPPAFHYAVISADGKTLIQEIRGEHDHCPRPRRKGSDWEFKTFIELDQENRERTESAIRKGQAEEWFQVRRYLCDMYARNENPLPSLRTQYPGSWTCYEESKIPNHCEDDEIRFYHEDGNWMISHIPKKK